MQDYRSEISDILSCDKQLADEIEFDLKRFDEEQRKIAKVIQTPAVATPHAQMVCNDLYACNSTHAIE